MGRMPIEAAIPLAQASFSGGALVEAVAITIAESGGRNQDGSLFITTDARNVNTDSQRSIDRGCAQFNSYWHPEVSDACADDPACAYREMRRVWAQDGGSFREWSTYQVGAEKQYVSDVQSAIDAQGAPTLPTPTPPDALVARVTALEQVVTRLRAALQA